jgi:hypothetical protein
MSQVYRPSLERFVKAGGESSSSPQEAVKGNHLSLGIDVLPQCLPLLLEEWETS